jgi:RHS repeat-associated protein
LKAIDSPDKPAAVTVGGNAATVDAAGNFDGTVNVNVGTNTVAVVATDASGNSRTNNYQVNVPTGVNSTLLYDLNGNLTNDGSKTYEWDAANRCTAINLGTHRTEFTYDGASRRGRIVEKDSGNVTSTKQFVWCGSEMCEERDGSNLVTKRYYPVGTQIASVAYFYTRDHLGSIRELTDANGTVRARYDYDPYGTRTKLSGDLDADFGFTGYYLDFQYVDLAFATLRIYGSGFGRFLSRDPIGEIGGANRYSYTANNPTNRFDPLGLWTAIVVGGATWNNPFGHVAIGVSRSGVYSFGTQDPNGRPTLLGSSFTDFLNSQATYRSMDVYLINATPEQEAAILGYLKTLDPQLPEVPGKDSHDTCASRTNDALGAAGLVDPSLAFLPLFNLGATSPFPGSSAMIGEIYSHGFVVHIPQGALYQYGAPFTDINPR